MIKLSSQLQIQCTKILQKCYVKSRFEFILGITELADYMIKLLDGDGVLIEKQVMHTITALLREDTSDRMLFLTFIRTLQEFVPANSNDYKDLGECYEAVANEILKQELGLFFAENEYNNSIRVDGKALDRARIVDLAKHYMRDSNLRMRVQDYLLNTYPLDERSDKQVSDVAATIQVMEISSIYSIDAEQLFYMLYPQSTYIDESGKAFYTLIIKLSNTTITSTPLQELQYILEDHNLSLVSISNAYDASKPFSETFSDVNKPLESEHSTDKSSWHVLQKLASLGSGQKGLIPIMLFVEYLASYMESGTKQDICRAKLRNWNNARANERGIGISQKEKLYEEVQNIRAKQIRQLSQPRYLLIVIKQDDPRSTKRINEQLFTYKVWLVNDKGKMIDKTNAYVSNTPMLLSEIKNTWIKEIHKEYTRIQPKKDFDIEIFLPALLLSQDVDQWFIDIGLMPEKLGIHHNVVVRSFDRAYDVLMHRNWDARWNQMPDFPAQSTLTHIETVEDEDARGHIWICLEGECKDKEHFKRILRKSPTICMTLNFVPQPSRTDHTHIFDIVLSLGVPIALWPRHQTYSANGLSEWLTKEAIGIMKDNISQLSTSIKEQRSNASEKHHYGNHVTLLWDDPHRLPPDVEELEFLSRKG